jgi:hypothetical protein
MKDGENMIVQGRAIPVPRVPLAINMVFVKEQCSIPSKVKVDEKFKLKWVIENKAAESGTAFIGMRFKGESYWFYEWNVEANKRYTLETVEITIADVVGKENVPKETATLDITWLTGYVVKKYDTTKDVVVTDEYLTPILVEVPKLPLLEIAVIGGIAVIAIAMIAIATKG